MEDQFISRFRSFLGEPVEQDSINESTNNKKEKKDIFNCAFQRYEIKQNKNKTHP